MYQCSGVVVFTGDQQYVESVIENHLGNRNNSDVRGVIIKNQKIIKKFPRNIGNFFPNLESLAIKKTSIDQISSDDLVGLENIKVFDFFSNQVKVVSGNLFRNNPLLKHVSFGANPLEHVTREPFDDLKHLESLYMKYTDCINQRADSNRHEVANILQHLEIRCRTKEMMINEIVNSPEFKKKVNEIITQKETGFKEY